MTGRINVPPHCDRRVGALAINLLCKSIDVDHVRNASSTTAQLVPNYQAAVRLTFPLYVFNDALL
jgi:hypothetical protein